MLQCSKGSQTMANEKEIHDLGIFPVGEYLQGTVRTQI